MENYVSHLAFYIKMIKKHLFFLKKLK